MRKHYLSFLSLLFAAFILLGGRAVLKAQQASSSAVKGGRWSDPAIWADKKVPAAGAIVTIDKGMEVVLDASPPALRAQLAAEARAILQRPSAPDRTLSTALAHAAREAEVAISHRRREALTQP